VIEAERHRPPQLGAVERGPGARFIIGVNLGDVIADDGDIYGDGVNIAARLEAAAGSICVSGTVRDQIRDKLPLRSPICRLSKASRRKGPRPTATHEC
jgi:adenylate cyclase